MPRKLTKKDLELFRSMLIEKRGYVTGTMAEIELGVRKGNGSSTGRESTSGDSADMGTEAFEQDFALSILQNEGDVVQLIDAALQRLENGEYGLCTSCARPIAKTRLKAIPWTPCCIDCQRKAEAS